MVPGREFGTAPGRRPGADYTTSFGRNPAGGDRPHGRRDISPDSKLPGPDARPLGVPTTDRRQDSARSKPRDITLGTAPQRGQEGIPASADKAQLVSANAGEGEKPEKTDPPQEGVVFHRAQTTAAVGDREELTTKREAPVASRQPAREAQPTTGTGKGGEGDPPKRGASDTKSDEQGQPDVSEKIRAVLKDRPLDRDKRPVHKQISERLGAVVDDLPPGTVLPPERVLVELFGKVNRGTIRTALTPLREEGRIEIRQGLGTTVTKRPTGDNARSPEKTPPLYQDVSNRLRNAITDGVLPIGSMIPTEQELEKIYGVSHSTMIGVINILKREGFLRTQPGEGTFVTDVSEAFSGDTTGVTLPKYITIADDFRRDIQEGRIKPGTWLPTKAQLAEDYGVSPNTMNDVWAALQFRGLIDAAPGIGTVVTGNKKAAEKPFLLPRSLHGQIADSLREQILSGHLAPGTKLTERALMEQEGVGLNTIKDALRALREQGYIKTKPGRGGGSFITAPAERTERSDPGQPRLTLQQKTTIALREKITSGELTGTLPPEKVFARQLGVSRNTLRVSIASLAKEGLITVKQGLGTNVVPQETQE